MSSPATSPRPRRPRSSLIIRASGGDESAAERNNAVQKRMFAIVREESDPIEALRRVKVPVLALNGELDLQVPPYQSLPAIRVALEEAGNADYTIRELPGLNHLFQTATTESPQEYAHIEETIAPVALDLMASWILERFGG